MSIQEGYVELHKENNGVGTITFFHPQSNSLPSHLLNKLAKTINNLLFFPGKSISDHF